MSVLAGQAAIDAGVKGELNTVTVNINADIADLGKMTQAGSKDLEAGIAALSDAQKALASSLSQGVDSIADTVKGQADNVLGGQASISASVSAVSDELLSTKDFLASSVAQETAAQTATITKGQDEIKAGVAIVENILTKETTRFPNPEFGQVEEAGLTKYYVQGHVEVLHDGKWGTVCNNGINDNAADILCKMGGYKGGEYAGGAYAQPTAVKAATIWLDNVTCDSADYKTIDECAHKPWGEHSCTHDGDVGVRCFY